MIASLDQLAGFDLKAADGVIGRVRDCYFDDGTWTVRYVVVDTDGWGGRRVLLSPISFAGLDRAAGTLAVSLSSDRIRNSPDAFLHEPISRQYERRYFEYYGYAPYWHGVGYWGPGASPGALASRGAAQAAASEAAAAADSEAGAHLRSSKEVIGYHIRATDGPIGHVDDLLADDESWSIQHLLIDTSNWIGGDSIVLPRRVVSAVSWANREVEVSLSRREVEAGERAVPDRLRAGAAPTGR
jgi:hypothetical protein